MEGHFMSDSSSCCSIARAFREFVGHGMDGVASFWTVAAAYATHSLISPRVLPPIKLLHQPHGCTFNIARPALL